MEDFVALSMPDYSMGISSVEGRISYSWKYRKGVIQPSKAFVSRGELSHSTPIVSWWVDPRLAGGMLRCMVEPATRHGVSSGASVIELPATSPTAAGSYLLCFVGRTGGSGRALIGNSAPQRLCVVTTSTHS